RSSGVSLSADSNACNSVTAAFGSIADGPAVTTAARAFAYRAITPERGVISGYSRSSGGDPAPSPESYGHGVSVGPVRWPAPRNSASTPYGPLLRPKQFPVRREPESWRLRRWSAGSTARLRRRFLFAFRRAERQSHFRDSSGAVRPRRRACR